MAIQPLIVNHKEQLAAIIIHVILTTSVAPRYLYRHIKGPPVVLGS